MVVTATKFFRSIIRGIICMLFFQPLYTFYIGECNATASSHYEYVPSFSTGSQLGDPVVIWKSDTFTQISSLPIDFGVLFPSIIIHKPYLFAMCERQFFYFRRHSILFRIWPTNRNTHTHTTEAKFNICQRENMLFFELFIFMCDFRLWCFIGKEPIKKV